jgi:membrane fusion protein, multidrug efflux system
VQLIPEMPGKLSYLQIPEGKVVHKGTLLAKINDSELQAQLKKFRSEIELLKIKESRNKKLLQINSISKEEYDNALNELQVKQAEEELVLAQIQKTEIRAPFTGLLGFKTVGPGAYISTSQMICSIQQIDPVKIEFAVPEKYRPLIKPGQLIHFTMDGVSDNFQAKIDIVDTRIDPGTRTLKVRALFPNSNRKLLPGAFVKIELNLQERENSILIPSQALIPVLKGYKVFLSDQGKAKEQMVETGFRTETEVQILKGLQTGDSLIISGIMSLKNGMPIKPAQINE